MAATVTAPIKSAAQRTISVYGTIALSGNYATGGEAIPASVFNAGTTKKPLIINIDGKAGFEYKYDADAGKLLVFSGATEASAGAYPAGVTGDTIRYEAVFPKFG